MKYKESIYSGVGAGLLFGVVQSFSVGVVQGALLGIYFGIAMGGVLHCFVNFKIVKQQTTLPPEVLLPGERLINSKLANLVIRPRDFGLDDFAFDGLLWVVGMKKKESLGGALHLTNYRLIFKSHRYNRIRGMTSIFLPTIERLENRTVLVFRKLAVTTGSAKVEFVVADVNEVVAQFEAAQGQLDPETLDQLQSHVQDFPEKCSEELAPWSAINKLNRLFNFGKKATDIASAVTNPLAKLSSLFIGELLDKTVKENWQRALHNAEQEKIQQPPERDAA